MQLRKRVLNTSTFHFHYTDVDYYSLYVRLAANTTYCMEHPSTPFGLTVHGVASGKAFSFTGGRAFRPINQVRS